MAMVAKSLPLKLIALIALWGVERTRAEHGLLRLSSKNATVQDLESGKTTLDDWCQTHAGMHFRVADFANDLRADYSVHELKSFLDDNSIPVDHDTEVDEIVFVANHGKTMDPQNDNGYFMMKRCGEDNVFADVYPDDFYGDVWVHSYPRSYGGQGPVLCIKTDRDPEDRTADNTDPPKEKGDSSEDSASSSDSSDSSESKSKDCESSSSSSSSEDCDCDKESKDDEKKEEEDKEEDEMQPVSTPITGYPTASSTEVETTAPTGPAPTKEPTHVPTSAPTKKPTNNPTSSPTSNPTDAPTPSPTYTAPTSSPTYSPTDAPSLSPNSKLEDSSRTTDISHPPKEPGESSESSDSSSSSSESSDSNESHSKDCNCSKSSSSSSESSEDCDCNCDKKSKDDSQEEEKGDSSTRGGGGESSSHGEKGDTRNGDFRPDANYESAADDGDGAGSEGVYHGDSEGNYGSDYQGTYQGADTKGYYEDDTEGYNVEGTEGYYEGGTEGYYKTVSERGESTHTEFRDDEYDSLLDTQGLNADDFKEGYRKWNQQKAGTKIVYVPGTEGTYVNGTEGYYVDGTKGKWVPGTEGSYQREKFEGGSNSGYESGAYENNQGTYESRSHENFQSGSHGSNSGSYESGTPASPQAGTQGETEDNRNGSNQSGTRGETGAKRNGVYQPEDDPDPQKSVPSSSENPVGSSFGDPHIQVWNGDTYDFHGGCDLVLIDNPHFANGLGMSIHIRTEIRTWWSYIETAVLRIGTETLQVQGGAKRGNPYWVNKKPGKGGEDGKLFTFQLAGYKVRYRSAGGMGQRQFKVILGHGDFILFKTFNDFVRVNVNGKTAQNFAGSLGLMGSYPDGKRIARDNTTEMVDMNAFGKEWQVQLSEPMLFESLGSGVHHPTECAMPEPLSPHLMRRLGESLLSSDDAETACAQVANSREKVLCVSDVLASNDIHMAGIYL